MIEKDTKAHELGFDAFGLGKSKRDNPFSFTTQHHSYLDWENGWNDAKWLEAEEDFGE